MSVRYRPERVPTRWNRNAALRPCFVAFSRRELEAGSLENALAAAPETGPPAPPAPQTVPPQELPPLPAPDIPSPDPSPLPGESPGDVPLPPLPDPDLPEPGEPRSPPPPPRAVAS